MSSGPAAGDVAERAALAQARQLRRRVEVAAHRTATGGDFANPDGTLTHQEYAHPVRVRRGDGWVPVDTTLSRRGDVVVPNAISVPVSISGGGRAALATVGVGDWSAALTWPAVLPRPALSGDTATYAGVLAGVDLTVTATESGFSERLVVRDRQAAADPALRRISFGLELHGLTATPTAGGLALRDRSGAQVVTVPQAMMWDASGDPQGVPRQARVGLALAGNVLTLRPDLGMLSDPATRFPVTIDPSFNANRLDWTIVQSGWPTTSYWDGANNPANSNGRVMVGLDPYYGDIARGFFRMNTSPVNGKHILKATFQTTEMWSYSCTAAPVELWWTGAINSGVTFNNQPGWNQKLGTANVAHGNENFGCGDASVEFDVTGLVRTAASSGWADATFGLRASNEGDVYGWKRFNDNPSLAIDYNSVPNTPGSLTIDNKSCGGGTWLGTLTPTMRATVSDPDAGQTQTVSFYWAATGTAISETNKVTQTNVANGAQAVMAVPAGKLASGGSYYFQVKTSDGTDTSALSGQCAFNVDTVRPAAPPAVTSTVYVNDGNFHGGVGQTASFTFGAASVSDVQAYLWGWQDPPTTRVSAPALGADATISATPAQAGIVTMYVRSVDRAGNLSDTTRYIFYVGHATTPAGEWTMSEGSGTVLADSSAGNHPVSLTGATAWTGDRTLTADRAVRFDGSTASGTSSGNVAATDQSYGVAAWVRLTSKNAWATAVCEQGSIESGMILQYDKPADRWAFTNQGSDSASPPALRVDSTSSPKLGVWTHLAATYDAGAGTLTLWVNGVKAGTVSGRVSWNASGPLVLGAELHNGALQSFFPGDIADVQVWNRAIVDDDVTASIGPAFTVGQWDLNTDGTDGSGHDKAVTPTGAATITPGYPYGHDGAGAAVFTGNGDLETTAPVVLTDQSYSVAAWVKLDDTGGFRTAVCQQGSQTCAFFLQYDKGDNRWSFTLHGSDVVNPPTITYVTSTTVPQTGVWTHLVGVYDAAHGTARIYVNGTQENSKTVTSIFNATGPVSIGRARYNGGVVDSWTGQIDHASIWLGALTDQQIVQLYNS